MTNEEELLKPGIKYKAQGVSLPTSIWDEIDAAAKRMGTSRSNMFAQILALGLERLRGEK